MEWQPMYIMKTIRLIGKELRWLVSRNFIGRGESQRPSWSTNTTNRPWTWTVAWTWANYGMHHLTNQLNHYRFISSIFSFFPFLTPPISIYSCRYLTLVFFSLVSFVTDEGSRAETSQLFVSATIKFCSLMSTFAHLKYMELNTMSLKSYSYSKST